LLEDLIDYMTKFDWYRLRFHARSTESYNPDDYSAYENYDSYLTSDACTKAVRGTRATIFMERFEIDISLALPFDEQFDFYKKALKKEFEEKRKKYLERWGYDCSQMYVTDFIKEVGGRKSTPFKEWDRLLKVYDLRKTGLKWIEISKHDGVNHYEKTKSNFPDSSAINLTKKDFRKAEKLIKASAKGTFPKI